MQQAAVAITTPATLHTHGALLGDYTSGDAFYMASISHAHTRVGPHWPVGTQPPATTPTCQLPLLLSFRRPLPSGTKCKPDFRPGREKTFKPIVLWRAQRPA